MVAELVKLCDPEAYYDKFLKKGIYPNGRPIHAFSTISFQKGNYGGVGSSVVQQNGITVCCVVSAEICLQNDSPMIIPLFEGASEISEDVENEILDCLNELLSVDGFISKSSLICKGTEHTVPLMWRLTLTIRVLNSVGNLLDAVIGAVTYALASVSLPHIHLDHALKDEAPLEKNEIHVLPEKSPLILQEIPVCSSFSIYEAVTANSTDILILCDPPLDISDRCVTKCNVIAGKNRILHFKLRGKLTDSNITSSLFEMAFGRQQAVCKSLNL